MRADTRPAPRGGESWDRVDRTITVLGILLTLIALAVPDLPLTLRLTVVALSLCVILFAAVRREAKATRMVTATLVVMVFVACGVGLYSMIPSRAEREVAAYVEETESASIWVDMRPTMFGSSESYLVEQWAHYRPSTWHGWEDIAVVEPVPAPSVIESGGVVAGRTVMVAGLVNAVQDFGGGELVIQLLLPPADLSVDDPGLVALVPAQADRHTLLTGAPSDPQEVRRIIYVRMPSRPFFTPRHGSVLVVKGTVIAYGRTIRGDSRVADVGYLAGSSAEWFTPTPSR